MEDHKDSDVGGRRDERDEGGDQRALRQLPQGLGELVRVVERVEEEAAGPSGADDVCRVGAGSHGEEHVEKEVINQKGYGTV